MWRASGKADHDAGETRFLVVPLSSESWIGLLDHEVSVPSVLSGADRGVTVRMGHVAGGAGVVEISPVEDVIGALGEAGLPDEQVVDPDTEAIQHRRSSWLSLPSGRLLDADKPAHASEVEEVERWRSAGRAAVSGSTASGVRVEAFGDAVISTGPDGTEVVRRYGQQLTARVVVEREVLR